MTAPTNPFASALEAHKDEEQTSNSHNPFVSCSSAAPPAASSAFPTSNSTGPTNPFAQSSTYTGLGSADPYTIQDNPSLSNQAGTHRFESANDISNQLCGLDFSDPPASSATTNSTQSASAFPAYIQQPSRATEEPSHFNPVDSTPSAYQASEPQASMATTYASPPGPPPAQYGGSNYTAYTSQEPVAPQQMSNLGTGNAASQSESDEAFARRLLAEDEARVNQDRQQPNEFTGSAYPTSQSHSVSHAIPSTTVGGAAPVLAPSRPRDPNEEKQWNTKEIYWQGRLQRIIIQNENGPCSLIALCNVLLLRGTLQITPEDRPAVSYSYLASLLGEHLIDVISTSGSSSAMDLEAALSILPQTQYGLDVNVKFASIFGFSVDESPEMASSSLIDMIGDASAATPNAENQKQRGELALFKLCNVPLVHGWLADEDDKETWGAVVERSGDYDKALDRVVAGDEVAKGTVVENGQGSTGEAFVADTPQDSILFKDAILIRNFLEATATQLTYPGLYALSTKLERGVPYALFRNSHLSVLYRPTEDQLRQAADPSLSIQEPAQPQLYQLVTDSTLENEDGIVWESVEDVDGGASRFFDGKFRQSKLPQDFIGNRGSTGQGGGRVDEDADFAYAQQLQDQECQRARRYQSGSNRQSSGRNQYGRPPLGGYPRPGADRSSSPSGNGNLISRMLANRKSNKRAPSSSARLEHSLANNLGGTSTQPQSSQPDYSRNEPSTDGPAPGQEYEPKKDKWYKKIF